MPDISMCSTDDNCGVATNCYRSEKSGTKPTEFRQSYMAFKPCALVSHYGCSSWIPTQPLRAIATEDARMKEER